MYFLDSYYYIYITPIKIQNNSITSKINKKLTEDFVPADVSKEYILKDSYKKKSDLELELQSTTGKREIEQQIEEIEKAIKEVEEYKDPPGIIR